ncbi:MAG TPA: hypothetical protein PLT70_05300, partial [bacterium]|nr:hypothetical protein [bacterium]
RPMRDGGNSYRSVVKNIPALQKRAGHLAVVGVITPLTSAHIAENAKHVMDELNINSYIMAADYTAPWTEDDLSKVIEQFLILEEWYLAKSRNGDSFYFSAFDAHMPPISKAVSNREISVMSVERSVRWVKTEEFSPVLDLQASRKRRKTMFWVM